MDPRGGAFRRLLPAVAILAIATASVIPVAAAAPAAAPASPPEAPAAAARSDGRTPGTAAVGRPARGRAPATGTAAVAVDQPDTAQRPVVEVPTAPVRVQPKAAPVAASGSGGSTGSGGSGSTAVYRGRNQVWIPALGVNRAVSWYACSRSTALAHVVYRWGCAGTNNVYLMGHASSVFRPLQAAYLSGRLRKGMKVIYADGEGRVRTYSVTFWKVVRPDGDVGWAYAAQSRPSLTLQTCVGANSEYRLVVRLVATG